MTDDKHPIPFGYQSLFDAIEEVGRILYPDDWTGKERELSEKEFTTNHYKGRWRSDQERYFELYFLSEVEKQGDKRVKREWEQLQAKTKKEMAAKVAAAKRANAVNIPQPYVSATKANRPKTPLARTTDQVPRRDLLPRGRNLSEMISFGLDGNTYLQWPDPELLAPTADEWRAVHTENQVIADLRDELSEMIKRRDDVENVCLQALWQPDSSLSPGCECHVVIYSGKMEPFPAHLWGDPHGKSVIRADYPGYYRKPVEGIIYPIAIEPHMGIDTSKNLLLILDGELAKTVSKMKGLDVVRNRRNRASPIEEATFKVLDGLFPAEKFPDKKYLGAAAKNIWNIVVDKMDENLSPTEPSFLKLFTKWRKIPR